MSRYLSVKAYAARCGISREQVRNRDKAGQLTIEQHKKVDGSPYFVIDAEAYPPQPRQKAGRPPKTRATL